MKITLLHYAVPPFVGGVEEFVGKQGHQLINAGHQVSILAGRGETWNPYLPVKRLSLIDIRQPHILKTKSRLDNGEIPEDFDALVDRLVGQLHRAVAGMDLVIAHNVASLNKNLVLTAALYRLSQSAESPRIILWHHDLAWTTARYQSELYPGWPWDLLRKPWPGVKHVVLSQARREELSALMGLPEEEISVVPGGIDLPEFLNLGPRTMELVKKLQLTMSTPILLAPVRITRRKNLELALKVLASLQQIMPTAALVVTGPVRRNNPANIVYFKELKTLRAKKDLQGSAHLLAEYVPEGLTDAMVADFYRLADVLLLTSRELPPFRALANGWASFFSPDDDPQKIAGVIAARLDDDPVYQMRARVREEYTWERIYSQLLAPVLENA